MTPPRPVPFTPTFDRAVAACAHAQVLVSRAAEAAARARDMRLSARRIRQGAVQTRLAWNGATATYSLMRRQVTGIALAMRDAGMSADDAAAVVRAHIRFVLYDGGLGERDAEPVVERASQWVDEIYRAA